MTPGPAPPVASRLPGRLGLASRLVVLGCVATLLVTGIGGWLLRERVQRTVMRSMEQGLQQRAERILALVQTDPSMPSVEGRVRSADEFTPIFSGWYWQFEAGPHTLRSRSLWDARLDTGQALPALPGSALLQTTGPRGEPLMGLRKDVPGSNPPQSLYVFGTAVELQTELARLDQVLWATLALLLLALVAATLVQVHWGLRPLRRLHRALSGVVLGEQERIGQGFGPDLDPLAREMDEVLTRNARVVARVRHHAADLSHALKKPLALLNAEAGAPVVRAEVVRHEVAGMSRLIDRHLSRAGSGSGDRRRIELAPPLSALAALMRRLHGDRRLTWEVEVPPGLCWSGEPTDFEEMLGNLLDNAGKWATQRVHVSAHQRPGHVIIQVQDDGPGIPAPQMEEAMRRGSRLDERIEGNGLGLAIVCDIAETYGGQLTLSRSGLGGLAASLLLPT